MPEHPFLFKREESQETIQINLQQSGLMEQQIQDWSDTYRNSTESSYVSNRQQAILSLLGEEFASCNELQERFCQERRLREIVEQDLVVEQIKCQEWDSAYTACHDELTIQYGEVQRLKDIVADLRKSLFTVGYSSKEKIYNAKIKLRKEEEQRFSLTP